MSQWETLWNTVKDPIKDIDVSLCHFLLFFSYRVASGAGLRRPSVRPSHILFTMWLPMALRTSVSSRGKSSRSSERTRDRWVPRFLWIPEHSMHMRAPRFRLAHVGSGEEHKGVSKLGVLTSTNGYWNYWIDFMAHLGCSSYIWVGINLQSEMIK